eukprot:22404_1
MILALRPSNIIVPEIDWIIFPTRTNSTQIIVVARMNTLHWMAEEEKSGGHKDPVERPRRKLASSDPTRFVTAGNNLCVHCKHVGSTTVLDTETGRSFCTTCFAKLRPQISISTLAHLSPSIRSDRM